MKDFKITLGPGVELGIHDLLDDNLLVIAMRRSGKTMRLRSIAEQVGKHMPIYVFDHEGEFASLREELPILICGEGGEVPARPETAGILARRLVEISASAVLDISTLTRKDKRLFVMAFLQAMIDLPRKLWGPRLIVLDEIHEFCPQGGKDANAQARETVNQLLALGGKRGLGVVAGTQRIAKFDNDSAAEFGNVCIGRTTLGADIVRACERLDFAREQGSALKKLKKGEMYAAGTSFDFDEAKLFQGILAKTTHPASAGQRRALKPPPPTRAILKYADELKDLQRVADTEKATQKSLADENAKLRAEVERLRARKPEAAPAPAAAASSAKVRTVTKTVSVPDAAAEEYAKLSGAANNDAACAKEIVELLDTGLAAITSIVVDLRTARTKWEKRTRAKIVPRPKKAKSVTLVSTHEVTAPSSRAESSGPRTEPRRSAPRPSAPKSEMEKNATGRCLLALLMFGDWVPRRRVAYLAGCNPDESTFRNALWRMRQDGMLEERDTGDLRATDLARKTYPDAPKLPTGDELIEFWRRKAKGGATLQLFETYVAKRGRAISDEEAREHSGLPANSTFRNAKWRLRNVGIIVGPKSGPCQLAPEIAA